MGDYVALLQFRRSVVPYVEIPPRLARILRGEFEHEDSALLQDLQWTEQRWLGAMPHNRPTFEEALAVAKRIHLGLRSDRDEDAMHSFVAKLFVTAFVPRRSAREETPVNHRRSLFHRRASRGNTESMQRYLRPSLWLCSLLALTACGAPVQPDASTDARSDSAAIDDVAQDSAALIDAQSTDSSAGDDASANDSATLDTGVPSDANSDADAARDASAITDSARDASATADAARDASADAFVPPPSCSYSNVDDVVVDCSGTYRMVSQFNVVPPSSMCPAYWQVGMSAPAFTPEQAATNAGCSTACIWRFSMSVTRLYCNHRSGYEVLSGTPDRCGQLFRFAEGYFTSVEAHDAMYPCRDM
jgi:hypothetical protein